MRAAVGDELPCAVAEAEGDADDKVAGDGDHRGGDREYDAYWVSRFHFAPPRDSICRTSNPMIDPLHFRTVSAAQQLEYRLPAPLECGWDDEDGLTGGTRVRTARLATVAYGEVR